MKKVGITWICMVISSSILILLVCLKSGWSEEWIQINPSAFEDEDEAGHSFQEAIFDTNYIYVVTSDFDFGFEDLHIKDPDRTTILWASNVYEDPNEWNDKVNVDPNVWNILFDVNTIRVDRLFRGFGYVYAGLDNDGNYQIFRFSVPDQKQEVIIDMDPNIRSKLRVDNGEEFDNKLYIGIYDEEYGGRVFCSDLPDGPIEDKDEVKNISGIQVKDPDRKIGLLNHFSERGQIAERLFVGTKNLGQRAAVLSYYDGYNWESSDPNTFKDPDDPDFSENIVAFLSMVEFVGEGWLLIEFNEDSKKQWALWKTEISSDAPKWQKQISSQDPNGPFADPNIVAVSELQPIGEYLYLACLCNDGGKIWKSYRGENEEWICVPSPSDPNNRFGPDNLLRGVFFNPGDNDHFYVGTTNDKGAQILTRLVPRIDISDLSMEDRFIGPEKPKINMNIEPNWEDPSYWEDPNHLPQALVFSYKEPNVIQDYSVNPNQTDSSLWQFDPNKFTQEGIYNLKWELTYGKDGEGVVRYLSFAWDANSPSAPNNLKVGEGDGHLEVRWEPSSDSLNNIAKDEDPNFSQSILKYKLEWWPEGDFNQVASRDISGDYSGWKEDIPNLRNDTTYEIRVTARDKANNVSKGSDVVTGIPQETLGWLELLEEKGGCFISSVYSKKRKNVEGRRRWLAGLKVGRYESGSEEADMVYGEDRVWPVQIEIGWIHRSYLEVGLSSGYMEMDGIAIKKLTREKSIDSVTFRMIPSSMTFRWIPFENSGHVLTPYLGGGINAWWYQEDEPKGEDMSGWNFGYHGLCGVRFLLDRFDPKHARLLEKDFGVKDTYLTLEVVYNWINDFGESRLDLGGAFYQAGILFLF
jgi:hypothetical protein